MGIDYYTIYVDEIAVAQKVTMEYALIFVKAIFQEYDKDEFMKISIVKDPKIDYYERKKIL